MTSYRGKHSRPASDDVPGDEKPKSRLQADTAQRESTSAGRSTPKRARARRDEQPQDTATQPAATPVRRQAKSTAEPQPAATPIQRQAKNTTEPQPAATPMQRQAKSAAEPQPAATPIRRQAKGTAASQPDDTARRAPVGTGEQRRVTRQRTGKTASTGDASAAGQTKGFTQPLRALKERAPERSERTRTRKASPDAFKHHDAVQETGEGARHSKRKTLLIVIPLILVLVAAVAAAVFAISSCSVDDSNIEPGIPVTVTIPEGSSTNEIANILKKNKVISSTQAFVTEVQRINAESSLKPGTYELETLMDLTQLVDILVAGPVEDGTRLTIPEGLTAEQTAAVVEESLGIPQADFIQRVYSASEYEKDYAFLAGVYNNSLEGFLYPKTYNVSKDASADDVIRILLDQFAIETSDLDLRYAEDHGLNLFNVVTLGSLIEKETAADDERALISSVIYNRLRDGMMLQIDATVVYALGASYQGGDVLYEDLEIESPYNTYKYYELPAGPICSPRIESIQAASQPAETNYYYYVLSTADGHHTFCETEEEFWVAEAQYQEMFGSE